MYFPRNEYLVLTITILSPCIFQLDAPRPTLTFTITESTAASPPERSTTGPREISVMVVPSRGTVCAVKETCTSDVLVKVESVIVRIEVSGGKSNLVFGWLFIMFSRESGPTDPNSKRGKRTN